MVSNAPMQVRADGMRAAMRATDGDKVAHRLRNEPAWVARGERSLALERRARLIGGPAGIELRLETRMDDECEILSYCELY